MRHVFMPGFALLLALAISPALFAQEDEAPEAEARKGVQWTEDYADAMKAAKAESKRIFIEFTATNWGYCKVLDRDVWPDEELAAQVAKDFVPLLIYNHKDEDTVQKYGVRGFPTFVVTDAEGAEEMRQVGAPFTAPDAAKEWFANVHDGLENEEAYEKAHADNPDDMDAAIKLAETYGNLGRGEKALPIYKEVVEKLGKEDKRYVDVRLKQADAVWQARTRETFQEDAKSVQEIYNEVLPALIEAKDDRAIDPGILNAQLKAQFDKDAKGARSDVKTMIEAFKEADRLNELKYVAAVLAFHAQEVDTAKAELKALAEKGPEDDEWVKRAKQALEQIG